LQTDGVATFLTLESLPSFKSYFDPLSIAQWTYRADTETFWTFDNPDTVALKMLYLRLRVPGGLGGAYFWAFKDDDANGTLTKQMAKGLGR
jgi:chitinase